MSPGADRSLLWPTVAGVAVLAVLLALGTWQLQRKAWKDGLIAQIAARTTAPPVPLEEALARWRAGEDLEYTRVAVEGRWLPPEVHLWAPSPAGPGWNVFAPLATGDGPLVIVNRGFVPEARRAPSTRPEPAAGSVRLVGLLRRTETKAAFTPDNDPARNVWYWRDLAAMRAKLAPDATSVAPFFLDAERGSAAPPGPVGGATRLEIANNHLQYAVTWYGLAATLVGVYLAFGWTRHRPRETPNPTT